MTKQKLATRGTGRTRSEGSANSLSLAAYELIRRAIQSGEYSPGDRVVEDEIAEKLNASRTPVRDAMRRLEAEGFLIHEPHRGMTIARLDHQTIMELYAMWDVLEGAAASMAARFAADAEIEILESLIEREKAESATPERMAEHNRRFHQAIYRCAHNRYLLKTISALTDSLNFLSRTTFIQPKRREATCEEHRNMVEAIRSRDPERAEKAAKAHIRASLRARLAQLAETAGP
jgi:DNA-binding GntR family transcriptional regulator